MPMPDSESVFVIPGSVLLWRIAPRPPNSAQVGLRWRNVASLFIFSSNGALSPAHAAQNREEGKLSSKCSSVVPLLASHPETQFIHFVHPFWCLAGEDALGWDFSGLL